MTYFNSERVIVRGVLLTNTFSKMTQGFFKTVPFIQKIYILMNKQVCYNVQMCCTDSISFIDIEILMFIISLTYCNRLVGLTPPTHHNETISE
jgi:hypothetical protein